MANTCATCRWSRTREYPVFVPELGLARCQERTCHVRGPQPGKRGFPVVEDTDFCGEWAALADQEERRERQTFRQLDAENPFEPDLDGTA